MRNIFCSHWTHLGTALSTQKRHCRKLSLTALISLALAVLGPSCGSQNVLKTAIGTTPPKDTKKRFYTFEVHSDFANQYREEELKSELASDDPKAFSSEIPDHLFRHRTEESSIVINSACRKQAPISASEALTQLLMGFNKEDATSRYSSISWNSVPSLEWKGTVHFENRTWYLWIRTLVIGQCTFDITFLSNPSLQTKLGEFFFGFMKGFRFEK